MSYKLNPITGKLDQTLSVSNINFPSTGFTMNDGSNTWTITINTDGALVTTLVAGIGAMVIGTDFTIT